MRIGFFFGNRLPESGGGFSFQETIIEAMASYDGAHSLCVFTYGRTISLEQNPRLSIHSLGTARAKPTLVGHYASKALRLIQRGAVRFLEREKLSRLDKAAHQNGVDIMWFPTPAFEPVATPYIYTVWDLQHRFQPFFPEVGAPRLWEGTERMFGSVIPRAAYVVTGTTQGKRDIMDYYRIREERIRVIPFPTPRFAVDGRVTAGHEGPKPPRPYLFYPAQFWPHKNHAVLLYVLKELKDKHGMEFDLVLTGSDKGNLGHVQQVIRELNLTDRVRILGFVSQGNLVSLYRGAFALLFPSFFGPDNLPPLEAFALGCPVIAARVAGAAEQLGDAALLVDPTNETEIADAVRLLLDDAKVRSSLIARGHIRAGQWTPQQYLRAVLMIADEFEPIRRCWSSSERYVPKS